MKKISRQAIPSLVPVTLLVINSPMDLHCGFLAFVVSGFSG